MSAAKPLPGHSVATLGAIQVAIEKTLEKEAGISPIEILKVVADGFEIASYPTFADLVRYLVDEIAGKTVGTPS